MHLLLAFAAPIINVPPPLPSPPVVRTASQNEVTSRRQTVLALRAMSAQCSDGPLDISHVETPMVDLLWLSSSNTDQQVTLRFNIDEAGRVSSIKRDPAGYGLMADLTPSLAASQFAQGKPRTGCRIVYQPSRSSIADANVQDLIAFSIFAQRRTPREAFDRISPIGSSCNKQRPAVLLRAFPDFDRIPATIGRMDWSMVSFDINASGKPVGLETYGSTGNKALDKASIDAVAQSRFAKGEVEGCLYPYWRRGETLAAPESKEIAAYRSEDSNCPNTVDWKHQPALVYPENFRRRDIEGWAVIAFDLAPWGEVGNSKVIAAEPAAEFGEAARLIVVGSSAEPSDQGYTNCVVKVRYQMTKQDRQAPITTD